MTKILIKHKSTLVLLIGLILGAEIVHGDNLDQSVTIEPFHIFTNEFSPDGDHSGRYTVWLWKSKDSLMGILQHREGGELGIGPKGTIENIEFDPKSGNLSFESNVSYCLGGSYKINFRFEGSLKKNALTGEIFAANGGNPWYRKRKKVTLEECCDDAPLFKEYVSIEEWKKDWFDLKPCQE